MSCSLLTKRVSYSKWQFVPLFYWLWWFGLENRLKNFYLWQQSFGVSMFRDVFEFKTYVKILLVKLQHILFVNVLCSCYIQLFISEFQYIATMFTRVTEQARKKASGPASKLSREKNNRNPTWKSCQANLLKLLIKLEKAPQQDFKSSRRKILKAVKLACKNFQAKMPKLSRKFWKAIKKISKPSKQLGKSR